MVPSDVRALLPLIGVPFRAIQTALHTPFDLAGLATATNIGPEHLARATIWPVAPGIASIGLGRVYQRHLLGVARRVCPACIATEPAHKLLWHLIPANACPIHSLDLIDRCHACAHGLTWLTTGPFACQCGARLDRLPRLEAAADQVAATATVASLLGLGPDTRDQGLALPSEISSLPTEAVIDLFIQLGRIASRVSARRSISGGPARQAAARFVSEGARICSFWPSGFHALLDRLAAETDNRPGLRILMPVRHWLRWLTQSGPVAALLRSAIAGWIESSPLHSRVSGLVEPTCMSAVKLTEAANVLGVAHKVLREVATRREALVRDPEGAGRGTPMLLDRSRVVELAADLNRLAETCAAARALRLGRKAFVESLERALLP